MVPSNRDRENRYSYMNSTIKLNPRSLAIAIAVITTLIYIICILFIALAPKVTMAFFSYILHTDLSSLARVVSWGSFITGLLFWSLGPALYAAFVARLYNSLLPR